MPEPHLALVVKFRDRTPELSLPQRGRRLLAWDALGVAYQAATETERRRLFTMAVNLFGDPLGWDDREDFAFTMAACHLVDPGDCRFWGEA